MIVRWHAKDADDVVHITLTLTGYPSNALACGAVGPVIIGTEDHAPTCLACLAVEQTWKQYRRHTTRP